MKNKSIKKGVLGALAILTTASLLFGDVYNKKNILVEMEKETFHYSPYIVPASETSYTRDCKETLYLNLEGEFFAKNNPMISYSTEVISISSPYELLSQMLYLADEGRVDDLLDLYNPNSKKFIASQPQSMRDLVFDGLASIERLESVLAFNYEDKVIVISNQVIDEGQVALIPWQTIEIEGVWHLIAGQLDVGFLSNLLTALTKLDGIVKDKFHIISPEYSSYPAGTTQVFNFQVDSIGFLLPMTYYWYKNGINTGVTGGVFSDVFNNVGHYTIQSKFQEIESSFASCLDIVGVQKLIAIKDGLEVESQVSIDSGSNILLSAKPTTRMSWPNGFPQWSGNSTPLDGVDSFVFQPIADGEYIFGVSCGTSANSLIINVGE